jgi:N-acetylneuraminic acid mutarotase
MHACPGLSMHFQALFVAALLTELSGCGGGSSTPSTPVIPPPVTLSSIAVTPNAPHVATGLTQQFSATGTYSDSTTADLTAKVSWTSATPTVGTINSSSGLAKALAVGSATITAKSGSVSGSATLNVTPAIVESIVITPNPAKSGVGLFLQLTATGTYSDGSTADNTNAATWTSSTSSVATVGPTTGLATGVSLGSSTITASIGSVTAMVSLSIITGTWVPTGSMTYAEANQSATLLQNGKVLLAAGGGDGIPSTYAQLYDPKSETWSTTGSLSSARLVDFTATLLPNGKVLVLGGFQGVTTTLDTAELYDPATGVWSPTASLPTRLCQHTATLLPNGKVLVAGGNVDYNLGPVTAAAELYDPITDTWSPTGNLIAARADHRATLLQNGKVLVAGGVGLTGYLSSAELYDPLTGTWSATASSPVPVGYGQTLTLLANNQVLITGGANASGQLSGAELYDPLTGMWSTTGSLSIARIFHTATLLSNGMVLVAGGQTAGIGTDASAEIYDPATGTWSATGSLVTGRTSHSATSLPNGVVLVTGGYSAVTELPTQSAELYW